MRLDMSKTYTYADYLNWNEEHKIELIDGIPYMMAPAPSRLHQEILFELAGVNAKIESTAFAHLV